MADPARATPSGGGERVDGLAEQFSALARQLEHERDVQGTLQAIVGSAVATIPGAQHASISAVRRRQEVETLASTDALPVAVDRAQYETEQGPCLESLFEEQTVRLPDLRTEQRWPEFTRRALELGARSMLAVQLYVEGRHDLGALNLLSQEPDAFGEDSERLALLFASHAAVALSGAQQQHQLRRGLDTRDLIGQAKGILMERHKLTGSRAFELLAKVSQDGNLKLHEVARELVDTGRLGGQLDR